jgi:hypothetical protein
MARLIGAMFASEMDLSTPQKYFSQAVTVASVLLVNRSQ